MELLSLRQIRSQKRLLAGPRASYLLPATFEEKSIQSEITERRADHHLPEKDIPINATWLTAMASGASPEASW
jgi:hypothetical protein